MTGNLEPEERVMSQPGIIEQISAVVEKLGWKTGDDISVDIGGTVVSGINQGENYNEKWATPYGVRKYNEDAFIVIKNLSRTPFVPSQPNPELKQKHASTDS